MADLAVGYVQQA